MKAVKKLGFVPDYSHLSPEELKKALEEEEGYLDLVQDFSHLSPEELKKAIEEEEKKCKRLNGMI